MKASSQKTLIKVMWLASISSVVIISLLLVIISFTKLPTFDDLENPTDNIATEIYSTDGKVLGRYFRENRVPISYEDLSPYIVDALISTEDERYYRHAGIDFQALIRVLVKTVALQDRSGGGGSTITQQLAKLLYTNRPASSIFYRIFQKLKEWITAIKLERSYTKEEILSMYLNEFDFLYQGHGIKAASETYFGLSPSELSITQAATLVGMLKNPYYFNPKIKPENALKRRNTVMHQMVKNKRLERDLYDSLKTTPIDISSFQRTAHDAGPAPYFRAELRKELKDILQDKKYRRPDGTPYDLERDGLKIYTTIDSRIQSHAEKAVTEHMSSLQAKFFKHWSWGKDPWNYGEDDNFLEVKELSLQSLMMNSERFREMKSSEFDPQISVLEEKYKDVEFTPYTLEILRKESDGEEYIDQLVEEKQMTSSRATYIRSITESKEWKETLPKWNALLEKADKIFAKKTKMKVFTYDNPTFVKDTIMSPMDSIKYHRMILQTGVLAVEPGSGHIKAWVGGVDFKHFKQDHVTVDRQVGSTFKPFVYASAITLKGISPCQKVMDIPYTIAKGEGRFNLQTDWAPKNSNGEYDEKSITLYRALQESKNTVSVYLMKQLGSVDPVMDIAKNFGIDRAKLPPFPSIALGAADLTVFEMTHAYATFANRGAYATPVIISRILDANGRLVYKGVAEENQALPEDENYVMVDMLKNVASRSHHLNQLKSENGGKTGTTQNQTDGWYMGITPNLVVGVWVGGEDRWIRFRSLSYGQGSVMARPIFVKLMNNIEKDSGLNFDKDKKFYRPPGQLSITIDCEKYENLNDNEENHPEDEAVEIEFFEG